MSNIWHDIPENRISPEDFVCVIEITKGSRKKYELDKETGYIILDRILYTSTHYPANYGFIPRTYGDDNDPLDVLLICAEPLEPLTLVRAFPIGVITEETMKRLLQFRLMTLITISSPLLTTCRSISLMKCAISLQFIKILNIRLPRLMR